VGDASLWEAKDAPGEYFVRTGASQFFHVGDGGGDDCCVVAVVVFVVVVVVVSWCKVVTASVTFSTRGRINSTSRCELSARDSLVREAPLVA